MRAGLKKSFCWTPCCISGVQCFFSCALCSLNSPVLMYWSHRNKWERFVFGHWVMICLSWEKQLFMGSFFTIALCSTLLGAHFSLKKMRQEGWAKYRSLLAFSLDSQLCRAAAFMSHQDTVTSHSQRQLDQDSTRVKFVSSVHTSCYYLFFLIF